MSLFFLLVLFFIGYFFIWPLIKTVFYFRKIGRSFTSGQSRQRSGDRRQTERHNVSRKKKIDKDIGEYINFQEISNEQTSYNETIEDNEGKTKTIIEDQIVDVEWEDI